MSGESRGTEAQGEQQAADYIRGVQTPTTTAATAGSTAAAAGGERSQACGQGSRHVSTAFDMPSGS